MTATSREVCLLLADLSGYTAYLAASEPDRAPALAADLVETVVRQLRPTFRLEKLEAELRVPLAPMTLWEQLTSPANRARVAFCAADRLASIEEVVEWRPFAAFTRTVRLPELPGDRRLTARHELEPDGDSTRLRVRWWGATATSGHARREHDRLRQMVT